MKLTNLYPKIFLSEAGPKGRTLSWTEIDANWPAAAPAYDRDVAPNINKNGNPSFREEDGWLVASLPGGERYRYNPGAERWGVVSKPSHWPVSPKAVEPTRYHPNGTANNQNDFEEKISDGMRHYFGRSWSQTIDSVFGPGSVKKELKHLWAHMPGDVGSAFDVLAQMYRDASTNIGQKRRTRLDRLVTNILATNRNGNNSDDE